MAPFSLPYCMNKRVFLRYLTSEPGWASGGNSPQVIGGPITWYLPFGVFNAHACLHWASSSLSICSSGFAPLALVPKPFPQVSALVSLNFLSSPICPSILFNFLGGVGAPVCSLLSPLFSLVDPSKVNFSVCLTFYLLLGECIQNRKVEVVN